MSIRDTRIHWQTVCMGIVLGVLESTGLSCITYITLLWMHFSGQKKQNIVYELFESAKYEYQRY